MVSISQDQYIARRDWSGLTLLRRDWSGSVHSLSVLVRIKTYSSGLVRISKYSVKIGQD